MTINTWFWHINTLQILAKLCKDQMNGWPGGKVNHLGINQIPGSTQPSTLQSTKWQNRYQLSN